MSSSKNKHWNFIREGWPVIVTIVGISWGIAAFVADAYIAGIVEREYQKKVRTEPIIAAIKNDITKINGTLITLSGNDIEIRGQLNTVVSRLDTLISIQLQD